MKWKRKYIEEVALFGAVGEGRLWLSLSIIKSDIDCKLTFFACHVGKGLT